MNTVINSKYNIITPTDDTFEFLENVSFMDKKIFLNLTVREALLWIGFYLLQSISLSVLIVTIPGPGQELSLLQHIPLIFFKLFLNIVWFLPIWWLVFYKLRHLTLAQKLWIHLAILPVFSISWTAIFALVISATIMPYYNLMAYSMDAHATAMHYIMMFGIMHAYNFWIETKRRFIYEQELRDAVHQSEMKALKAQIQPHFLFNTLNSISASVPPNLEKTRVLIAQLADTFRYALKASEQQTLTLEDELNFIKTWLSLEKQRFQDRLTVVYDIDPFVTSATIGPMILQPLVENAIEHGINPLTEGGIITITCKRNNGFVDISVCDNGPGCKHRSEDILNRGIGLKNTNKRIQQLYKNSLQIDSVGSGFCASFKLPVNH